MADHSRADWNAAPPKRPSTPLQNVPYGVVHHIGGGDAYTSNVAATLHQIQAMELHGAYVDFSYNIGVDQDGNLWAGRGDVADGATLGYSGKSYSVLAICNASAPGFVATPAMLEGIGRAFREAMDRGVLARNAYIDGHHWYDTHVTNSPTACPGTLEQQIPIIRSFVTGPPAPTPPVPSSKEEPMLIAAKTQPVQNRFRGAKVDFNQQTITPRGNATISPDPHATLVGKLWEGAYNPGPDNDGESRVTVVTGGDEACFTFTVK